MGKAQPDNDSLNALIKTWEICADNSGYCGACQARIEKVDYRNVGVWDTGKLKFGFMLCEICNGLILNGCGEQIFSKVEARIEAVRNPKKLS